MSSFCVFIGGVKVILHRLPPDFAVAIGEGQLWVYRPEFRRVAHHDAVGTENHERSSALGKFRDDDVKLCFANLAPHHPDQLLGGVDVAPGGVKQQFHAFVRPHIVKKVDEWHSVILVNHTLAARHVAD